MLSGVVQFDMVEAKEILGKSLGNWVGLLGNI